MRKTLVIIACSTLLLTACSSKEAENTKPVVNQTTSTPEVTETAKDTTQQPTETAPDIKHSNTEDATQKTTESDSNKASEDSEIKDLTENTTPASDDKTGTSNSDDDTNNDIADKVVVFIMSGQEDKPAADQILWNKTFLDKVDLNDQYRQYLSNGGVEDDVERFAEYITNNAPIADDWQEMFKADLKATYGMDVTKLEDLGDNLYQAYVISEDNEVPYVVVNARTGYFHG